MCQGTILEYTCSPDHVSYHYASKCARYGTEKADFCLENGFFISLDMKTQCDKCSTSYEREKRIREAEKELLPATVQELKNALIAILGTPPAGNDPKNILDLNTMLGYVINLGESINRLSSKMDELGKGLERFSFAEKGNRMEAKCLSEVENDEEDGELRGLIRANIRGDDDIRTPLNEINIGDDSPLGNKRNEMDPIAASPHIVKQLGVILGTPYNSMGRKMKNAVKDLLTVHQQEQVKATPAPRKLSLNQGKQNLKKKDKDAVKPTNLFGNNQQENRIPPSLDIFGSKN